MKTRSILLLAAALCTAGLLHAAQPAAGPNGGRVLNSTPLKAEFLVKAGRHVEITFYDDHANPILPGEQVVAVIAEPAAGRVTLNLEKTATGFVSQTALPPGEPYRVVVQIRSSPDARPQNFRLDLNLALCGECQHAEYACTCAGH